MTAMLGQNESESRARPQFRERSVEERRVLVRVDDVNAPPADLLRQPAGDAEIESRPPPQHNDVDAIALELGAERSLRIEAEHCGPDAWSQPPDRLDHQPLGTGHLHDMDDQSGRNRVCHRALLDALDD